MNQRQQNPRYAADRALVESLTQLQKTLQAADKTLVQPLTPASETHDNATSDLFDLSSFEQAVADIEAFMQARQRQEGES